MENADLNCFTSSKTWRENDGVSEGNGACGFSFPEVTFFFLLAHDWRRYERARTAGDFGKY